MNSEYIRRAIEKSHQSFEQGNFPAGAVVVRNGEVIAEAVSSPYPSLFHADSKAVTEAYQKYGPLTDATLYVGLECCLMCLSVAYWAGIRNIYFAIPKSKVSSDYYETKVNTSELSEGFNEPITLHHISEHEIDALRVIKEWEEKQV